MASSTGRIKASTPSALRRSSAAAAVAPSSHTSSTATATASRPTSRPETPAVPSRDLTVLITLPLRLTLVPIGGLPERVIQGALWSYDPVTELACLSMPLSTTTPMTGKEERVYNIFHTSQIQSLVVLSTTPSLLPDPMPLPTAAPHDLERRVEKALVEDARRRARIGKGVSREAQALFDALGKTLPVRWHEQSFVVMDEVIISPPYTAADVKGAKGASERVERVKKVLEGERQRLQRQGP